MKSLAEIHKRVLSGFKYVTDLNKHGVVEDWRFPENIDSVTGDCDDFAIACRKLVKETTPHTSRLVVCTTEQGEWHLVCAVGQYILDNRQKSVVTKELLERRGYKFMYVSGLNPGDEWKTLRN
jgi:predicted transglutaminase-like cysteine proteinase